MTANTDKEVMLVVNGRRYGGWKSARITRSVESVAGSFTVEASDRWDGRLAPWPIREEDAVRVQIGAAVVIDGYIDKRSLAGSATSRTLSYSGRDRAGALVDCSAVLGHWTFRDVDVASFVAMVAEPFGVAVTVQQGLELAKVPKVSFSPGDSAFEVVRRAVGDKALLLVSDGAGGIVITRAGTARAAPLIEDQNIMAASVEYDASGRFRHYVVSTQTQTTGEAFGDVNRVMTGGSDAGVRRTNRVLYSRPDGYNATDARRWADWNARTRAARAAKVSVTVRGWEQPDGQLWPINALTRVVAPRLVDVDGDMLISQVDYSVGARGTVTQISLVRPDAFTPEPTATKTGTVRARPSEWPELRNGAAPLRAGDFDPDLVRQSLATLIGKLKGEH